MKSLFFISKTCLVFFFVKKRHTPLKTVIFPNIFKMPSRFYFLTFMCCIKILCTIKCDIQYHKFSVKHKL